MSLVMCEEIPIVRDFIVEYTESFSFGIASDQTDPAILVSSPSVADVFIQDEPEGRLHTSIYVVLHIS